MIGAVLAFTLVVLTMLEKSKRVPAASALLPALVVAVLIYLEPSKVSDEDPPESELDKLLEELYSEESSGSSGGGGQEKGG